MKGETVEERTGFARRNAEVAIRSLPIWTAHRLLDTAEPADGWRHSTFRGAAFRVARERRCRLPSTGGGISRALLADGQADAEEIGVSVTLEPEAVRPCYREVGIGFLFATLTMPRSRTCNPCA